MRAATLVTTLAWLRPVRISRCGVLVATAKAVVSPRPIGETPVMRTILRLILNENAAATSVPVVEALKEACEVIPDLLLVSDGGPLASQACRHANGLSLDGWSSNRWIDLHGHRGYLKIFVLSVEDVLGCEYSFVGFTSVFTSELDITPLSVGIE